MNRYDQTRSLHQHPEALVTHRYPGCGARSRLLTLMDIMNGLGTPCARSDGRMRIAMPGRTEVRKVGVGGTALFEKPSRGESC